MAIANPARGEATIVVAGNQYVIALTMESLAQISNAIGDPTFDELYRKLQGGIFTIRTSLALIVQGGTADGRTLKRTEAASRAVRDFTLGDLVSFQQGIQACFEPLMSESAKGASDEGNAEAASAS